MTRQKEDEEGEREKKELPRTYTTRKEGREREEENNDVVNIKAHDGVSADVVCVCVCCLLRLINISVLMVFTIIVSWYRRNLHTVDYFISMSVLCCCYCMMMLLLYVVVGVCCCCCVVVIVCCCCCC